MTKQTRIQKHLDNLSELAQETNVYYEDGTEFNIYDLKELMAKELVAIEEIQDEEEGNIKYLFASDEMNSIKNIARSILDIETFQLAKNEKANFHDLHVTDIRIALMEAYFVGVKHQEKINKELVAIEEIQKETVLRDYGKRLSDVIEDLGFMQSAFDLVPNPKMLDEDEIALYFSSTFKLLVYSMDKLTGVIEELDEFHILF